MPDQTFAHVFLRADLQPNTHRGIVPMLMSLVLTQVQRWLTYHKTIRELERLSERELSDLGIGRADIRHVARQAAR
jgi:uncharacterized protein YjiS (DUF1127 family)